MELKYFITFKHSEIKTKKKKKNKKKKIFRLNYRISSNAWNVLEILKRNFM